MNDKQIHYHPALLEASPAPLPPTVAGPVALYVHIPFCGRRCYFCEFAVVAGKSVTESLVEEYLAALRAEMRAFLAAHGGSPRVELVQLGGGTPTALTARALGDLLDFIVENFDCTCLSEIIVEGFPTSITPDRLAVLERFPQLKLNIGIQSFHTESLESVGRDHEASAEKALAAAAASSISSVGVDLIFGLPFSTPDTVGTDIQRCRELGAEHFALYPLWIYDRTALKSRVRSGKVVLPGKDSKRAQLFDGAALLSSLGYSRYTAFHYATAATTRHQYGLWQMLSRDWIGFGMSAMSHVAGTVSFNERDIRAYLACLRDGASPVATTRLMPPRANMNFVLLYGLRHDQYPTSLFLDRFGVPVEEVFGDRLHTLTQRGLLTRGDSTLSLTLDGVMALSDVEKYINTGSFDDLAAPPEFVNAVGPPDRRGVTK